jgi:hypothetical protein
VKTLNPEALRRAPIEAVAMPFPNDEHTPPVTKIYFVSLITFGRLSLGLIKRF